MEAALQSPEPELEPAATDRRLAAFSGWSFGGVLAYEIARQSAERGTVCPLLLIDSAPTPLEYLGLTRSPAELRESFVSDLLASGGRGSQALGMTTEDWQSESRTTFGLVAERLMAGRHPLGL